MKKKFTSLTCLLLLMIGAVMGQNYQLPNNDFNGQWASKCNGTIWTAGTTVPVGWHSFTDAAGSWAWAVSGQNYSSRETGRSGAATDYCCRMVSHSVWGVKANGNMTTGQIKVGSTNTSDESNRNITDKDGSDGHSGYWAFSGRPDSLRLYMKFQIPKKNSGSSRSFETSIKFHLHGDVEYVDHLHTYEDTWQDGKIANVYGSMTFAPLPQNSSDEAARTSPWYAFEFPVKYFDQSSHNAIPIPNLNNTVAPSYALCSFTTNVAVGGGEAGDAIYVDDVWFVYNKKLSNLVVGTTSLASELSSKNNAAYALANGATTNTFSSTVTENQYPTFTYSNSICPEELATINIIPTTESGLATATVERRATLENPYAIIKVSHTDNSYYYFRVHFANVVNASIVINGNTNPCSGEEVTLTANGASSYTWSTGETGSSITVTPTANVSYSVTGSVSGCNVNNTVSIELKPSPNVTIDGLASVCPNADVTLTASGANTYVWSDNQTGASATFTPSEQTTYTVTGTGANGCTATATRTVTMKETPTISGVSQNSTPCPGSDVVLTVAGSANCTYAWSNQATGASITVQAAPNAQYTVTATGSNGCTTVATHTLSVAAGAQEVFINGPSVICANDMASYTTDADMTCSWGGLDASIMYAAGNTANVSDAPAGTYTLTLSGTIQGSPCPSFATKTIQVIEPTVALSAMDNQTICAGSTATLTAAATTNADAIAYAWTGGLTGNSVQVSPSETQNYSVTATATIPADLHNCVATDTKNVTVNVNVPAVALNALTDVALCEGANLSIEASLNGTPTGTVTYAWTVPAENASTTQSYTLNNVTTAVAGTYTVAATATQTLNGVSCTATDTKSAQVTVHTLPNVTITGSNVLCSGSTATLTAHGAASYVWNNDTHAASIQVANAGTYQVTGTDAHNCVNTAVFDVSVSAPAVALNTLSNQTICAGSEATLTATLNGAATGEVAYAWSCGQNGATATVTPNTTTTYVVTATATIGDCSASDEKEVTVNVIPQVTLTAQNAIQTVAFGNAINTITFETNGTLAVDGTLPDGLSFDNVNNRITGTPAFTGTRTFSVVATAENNCSTLSKEISITVDANANIELEHQNQSICPGEAIVNITVLSSNATVNSVEGLPAGVAWNENINAIVGSTTQYGVYNYTVHAINNATNEPMTASGQIEVKTPQVRENSVTYCESDEYSSWNGMEITGAGTYDFQTRELGANGCNVVDRLVVTVVPVPTATIVVDGMTATISDYNEDYYYEWSNGDEDVESVTHSTPGTYSLMIDNGVCAKNVEYTIASSEPIIETDITTPDAICAGGQLALTNPTVSFTNSTAWQISETENFANAQTYTDQMLNESYNGWYLRYMATNGQQSVYSNVVTITVNALPEVAISGNTSFCAGTTTTLTASGATSYVWNDESNNTALDVNAAGTYRVTGTDANGCSNTAEFAVTVNALPTVAISGTETICVGATTTLTASGATSYVWNDESNNTTLDVNAAGTYRVTGTDANGCSNTAEFAVTVNALPTVAISGIDAICAGATTTLTASGATSYVWNDESNNTTLDVNAAGTYSVTGTDANGCSNTAEFAVTVNALPTVAISGTETICAGATTTLTASGATSYVWNEESTNTTLVANAAGTYRVTGTDANGCSNTAEFTVTVNALPTVTISGTETICVGATTTLTASGATSYVWNDESNNTTLVANAAGTYRVTGTDANGCSNTAEFAVTVNALPTVAISGIDAICAGATTTLTASGATSYVWNDESTNTTLAVNAAETYSVTGTDANGCSNTAEFAVTVNALPTVTISGTETICAGATTTLTASGATSYVWNDESNNTTLDVNAAGTYSVTGTDANGCTNRASVEVVVNTPSVTLNAIEGSNTLCKGADLHLRASVNGTPVGTVSYVWNTQNTQNALYINNITTAQAGTYTVVATATNTLNGVTCEATDTKEVVVVVNENPATPVLLTTNNNSCATPNGSIAIENAVNTNTYTLTNGSMAVNGVFEGLNAGNYVVTVADNNTGCRNQATATISTDGSNLSVSAESAAVCLGDNATLTATSSVEDVTYAWSGPAGFTSREQNPALNAVGTAQAGTYTLVVTETATHCTATTTATLTVNVPQHASTTQAACGSYSWNNQTYTQTGVYTYEHQDANGCTQVDTLHLTINNPVHTAVTEVACDSYEWNGETYQQSGTYTYAHEDANGCMQVDTLHLTINSTPVVTISGNLSVVEGNSTTLTAAGADSYVWSTDETTPAITVTPEATTTYSVVGTSNNCTSAPASVTVTVTECVVATKTIEAAACGSYTWYGVEYTASTTTATHTVAGVAADGCDSVYTLHLTIWNADATEFEASACGSYTWINDNYTRSGDYVKTFANVHGCDSVVTLHLTINNPVHTAVTEVACDSYEWNGETYQQSGTYTYAHEDANGCMQVDTLHLTINSTPVVTISGNLSVVEGNSTTLTAAGADSYVWSTDETTPAITVTPEATTTYSVVGTSNNCTSAPASVTVTVTECVVATKTIEAAACGSYTWYGVEYTASTTTATHTVAGVAADGCDSVYTLHLTIWNADATEFEASACGSYTWISDNYTRSGDYVKTFANVHGCDSVVTLHLTINNPVHTVVTEVACDSYEWNGETYQQSGTYTYAHEDANGCMQVDTLHLTINSTPVVTISGNLSVVEGNSTTLTAAGADSYVWSTDETTPAITVTPEATTTYSVVGTSNNCTSAPASVTVNVLDCVPATKTIEAAACGSYTWYGVEYTASTTTATHTVAGVAADGCDSVYTLHLTIWNADATEFEASACGSYTWINDNYTRSGDYVKTFANVHGCDSVVTLHLTINNPAHTAVTEVACGSYEWNGETYQQSGTYTYAHEDANGCEQVDTLHLTINNPAHTAVTEVACGSYEWNGTTYNRSGNYTFAHEDANGCEQVDTLHLTINNPVHTAITEVACGEFEWNGTTYNRSGNYIFAHEDANGCEQVDTLHLTINNPVHTAVTEVACGSYEWNGTTYNRSGNYTFAHEDANGCEQVDTLHLTINNPAHTAVTEVACGSYEWNGTTYNRSGNYTFAHEDANGCEQVDTLHLTINLPVATEFVKEACNTYTWNEQTYQASGDYQQTFANVHGCDSVVTLHLTILNTDVTEFEAVACSNYTWINDNYTQSGDYVKTFTNVHGCDSVVTLHLTINQPYATEFLETACESYTWIFEPAVDNEPAVSETYVQSGNYMHTFTAANGCDSVVTMHLTINNPVHESFTETACGSFAWVGNVYTESGVYTYEHFDNNGCTQVDTLHLTINNPVHESFTETACGSYEWVGTVYTQSGDYTYAHADNFGCEQVDTMHLTIYNPVHESETVSSCSSYTWNGIDYTESGDYLYTHEDNNGCVQVDTLHLTIWMPETNEVDVTACSVYDWNGTYYDQSGSYEQTFTNVHGCDSVVTLNLTINQPTSRTIYATICNGASYEADGFNEHTAGEHNLYLTAANGCDSIVTLVLSIDYNCSFDCGDRLYDVDYNGYNTKAYNGLCWMTENLRTQHYSDGTEIPMAMVYNGVNANNDTVFNLATYGRLYDWASASRTNDMIAAYAEGDDMPMQGVCPQGWRLPTKQEMQDMNNLYAQQSLRSANYWIMNGGDNASGFDLRPAGFYNASNARCENMGGEAYFYTSTMEAGQPVHLKATCGCWEVMFNTATPVQGFSVRCVK